MQGSGLRRAALVAVVVALVLLSSSVSAINFILKPGTKRCFTEEIPGDTTLKITYAATNGYAQFVDVTLTDPAGVALVEDVGKNQASHVHHTQGGGDYVLCFTSRVTSGARAGKNDKEPTVAFTFKVGSEGIDYKKLATKEKLKPMEVQLRVMEDTVRSIHSEYVYYKDREAEMRSTNEHMTAKVVWMAVLVIIIFVVFSYMQLRHLKSYFRKKRMID